MTFGREGVFGVDACEELAALLDDIGCRGEHFGRHQISA
jgi:hypothetical protein